MNNTTLKLAISDSDAKQGSAFSRGFVIASVIIVVAQIPICSLGNVKVSLLLYKQKQLRKVPHILLGNLSVTGVLIGAVHLPCYLAGIVWVNLFHRTIYPALCITKFAVSVLLFNLQTLTLVAMATDRHDSVLHPFRRRITPGNVRKLLTVIWSVAGLLAVVVFPLSIEFPYNCARYTPLHENIVLLYTMVVANSFLFGTIVFIFVTFLRIVKKLRSSAFAESNQRSEIRVTRFSYSLMFCFLLSWLPLILFNIVSSAVGLDRDAANGPRILLVILSNMNYLANPFLHMKMCEVSPTSRNPELPGQAAKDVGRCSSNKGPQDSSETTAEIAVQSVHDTQM